MIITRCGFGSAGCEPMSNEARLQSYAASLGGNYSPAWHAARATEGLAAIKRLQKHWKRKRKSQSARRSNAIVCNTEPGRTGQEFEEVVI